MIGRHINNYEITALIGEGGMGRVYLAQHSFMGRKAAVKVLHPDLVRNEVLTTRFMNEARAANAIRHPNIIDIIDVGLLPGDGTPFLMMEFLDGETLAARLLKLGRFDLDMALDVAAQAASALGAAHAQGIIHRDLKPDNLFLVPDQLLPRGERVKILDFGIAKLRKDVRGNSDNTQSGTILGTVMYMSPEQCQGQTENIDARSDIYSFGIILFEMLLGAPPFQAEGFADVLIAHVTREPPSLHQHDPRIPAHISNAVARCLAKNPEDRFASMPDLLTALFSPVPTVPTLVAMPPPPPLPLPLPIRSPFPQAGLDHISTQAVLPRKSNTWIALAMGAAILGVILALLVARPDSKNPAIPAAEATRGTDLAIPSPAPSANTRPRDETIMPSPAKSNPPFPNTATMIEPTPTKPPKKIKPKRPVAEPTSGPPTPAPRTIERW